MVRCNGINLIMKKFSFKIFIPLSLISIALVSCGNEEKPKNSNWDIYCNALALTSSLKTYNIDITSEENGTLSFNKKVLSETDSGFVAYVKTGLSEKYWVDGYSYLVEKNEKIKYGESLSRFLNLSNEIFSFSYDDVKDSFSYKTGVYSFVLQKEGYSKVVVESTKNDYFILTLDCVFYKEDVISKKVKYDYVNPGENPTINLPEDLEEYHF